MLRDHLGVISVAFSKSMGSKESNKAELRSIRRALTLESDLKEARLIKVMKIESYCIVNH